jgi:hypothetical protein
MIKKKLQEKLEEKIQEDNNTLINKNFKKIIVKVMTLSFEVMQCTKQNCSAQKEKIMANKNANSLFTKFNKETNIDKKLKLTNKYTKNTIIYEYTKCIIKYCNKMLNDIMNLLKSIISILPENNPKRLKLDNMIAELKILLKTNELTKKEFKKYIENITELMTTIKSTSI